MGFRRYEGALEMRVDGTLLAEATSGSVREASNDRPVTTMHQGLAGFSDGPATAEAQVSTAIPRRGFEFNFLRALSEKREVEVVLKVGGKRRTYAMKVMEADVSGSTDASAVHNIRMQGRFVGER